MDQDLYLDLQRANKSVGVIRNINAFECVICLIEIKKGKGVVLRDCLHEFCDLCLVEHIKNNMDVEIKCPFIDNDYSCLSVLRQNEVKSIVSPELYKKFLHQSLKAAEMTTPNSFHCQTVCICYLFDYNLTHVCLQKPGCIGWCVVEGSTREFRCPICAKVNCIQCEVSPDFFDAG
jgi:RanBP-type and C3HC4-type zinc finger-containing protein 1